MPQKIRIATFNLENLDNIPGTTPNLQDRINVMLPQLERLNADIICLQEIHGQETPGQPRKLLALKQLLQNTPYSGYNIVSTKTENGTQVYDKRNLVILSHLNIVNHSQYKHDHVSAPRYQKVMAIPAETEDKKITWERPVLYVELALPNNEVLHLINLHLKSRIPSNIDGQKLSSYKWKSASGWAEGYFLSSMKRVGQALETRMLVDKIFDNDENALIVVCGDFNSDFDNVPVQAICGDVENTGNGDLANRVLVPCEKTVPEPSRYSLLHHGKGEMLDHILVSRSMLAYYINTEIHNELLHDESIAFATDKNFPEPDHAPVVAEFLID